MLVLRKWLIKVVLLQQLAKQTIVKSNIYGKYAHALFIICKKSGSLSTVLNCLNQLLESIESSAELKQIIADSNFSKHITIEILNDILQLNKANKISIKFVELLVINKRLNALKIIVKDFEQLILMHNDCAKISIEIIEDSQDDIELKNQIEQLFKNNFKFKNYLFDYKVNNDLIAGFCGYINDIIVDFSLKGRLNKMTNYLKEQF